MAISRRKAYIPPPQNTANHIDVRPANENMERLLRHPSKGGFTQGRASWPNDAFTQRRLLDGDVVMDDDAKESSDPIGDDDKIFVKPAENDPDKDFKAIPENE